jgi:hypothetical protein
MGCPGGCGKSVLGKYFGSGKTKILKTCETKKDYYEDLLLKVESQLQDHELISVFVSTVKTQINIYDNYCNKYEEYIRDYIKPLIK